MDFSDYNDPISREIRADLTFLINSEIDDRDVLFFLTTQPMAIALNQWQFRIDIHMSHFAYGCKMRYPLNLVLESWEYLWFY